MFGSTRLSSTHMTAHLRLLWSSFHILKKSCGGVDQYLSDWDHDIVTKTHMEIRSHQRKQASTHSLLTALLMTAFLLKPLCFSVIPNCLRNGRENPNMIISVRQLCLWVQNPHPPAVWDGQPISRLKRRLALNWEELNLHISVGKLSGCTKNMYQMNNYYYWNVNY